MFGAGAATLAIWTGITPEGATAKKEEIFCTFDAI